MKSKRRPRWVWVRVRVAALPRPSAPVASTPWANSSTRGSRSRAHTLGFRVVDAPDEKASFRGRDFFKLTRIELRCEQAPGHYTKVEARVEVDSTTPLAVHSSPVPAATTMEVDSRPPPTLHHYQHHDQRLHYPTPVHQPEPPRQSLPPPPAPLSSTLLPQKSPSNPPPLPSPVQHAQPSHREPTPTMPNRTRELPPVATSHLQTESPEPRTNGPMYPRPAQGVQLDAIERLQTQVSHNSSALSAHSRDMRQYEEAAQTIRREFQTQFHHQNGEIRRVDEAVGRLQLEMRGIRESIDALARRGAPPQSVSVSAQDSALELMAQQVAVISHRTNEIDTLKITIEIMKNKIQRLEDATPAQVTGRPYASPHETAQTLQSSQATSSYHSQPAVPHAKSAAPPVTSQRTQSYHSHGSPSMAATPELSQRTEQSQPHGWATVNAGTKRTHVNGLESAQEPVGQASSSPKRLKLAPIEPRTYASSSGPLASTYDYADSDSDAARVAQSQTHVLSSQPLQHPHAAFVTYSTQDAPSEDSWRPESQRIAEVRTPRGRGRGGGPGSRGGRVRKSAASHVHQLGTPEWERESWQGSSQISPEGYYYVSRPTRGIVRRGSGGGGGSSRGGRPSSSHERAMNLGLQGVTAGVGIGLPADPYAHTKKTRTKPIRNADGVLIRKDGRPDMRSQSSAANLRKVHAKREDGGSPEPGFTPSNMHSSVGAETPSPTTYGGVQDLSASVAKRHSLVLNKMFPEGLEKSRQEHDYARKVFEDNQDHAAHRRAQTHHHIQHDQETNSRPLNIKREQANTDSPRDGDIHMDHPEDHADDEGQTPGGQTDNSGHDKPSAQTSDANATAESSQTVPTASA
ncbi:hypothetical protein CC80DRAFT_529432 [Byssothecium circinans]|uniref:Uncharacterized protein n=1 Tax=Byssothecium circinans TaxID=147558 RepID=A0A6A5T9U0_9PLEO|nr:hypothetical protein CC80DRAFT_529432 [Byssothecium circinans]